MPGDGAAPLRRRRRTEAGVGLGIGSGGASRGTGGGSAPDALLSSDESPVAWLLWSLAAASALQSLSLDRGVVNLLRSAHLLGLPKEKRKRGSEGSARDFLGRPMERAAVEIKRRLFVLFLLYLSLPA